MGRLININENGIYFCVEVLDNGDVRFLSFSSLPYIHHSKKTSTVVDESRVNNDYTNRIVELQCSGENQIYTRGSKHTGTMPGNRLKYKEHKEYRNSNGLKLEIILEDKGLHVTCHYQFYSEISVVRCWTEVENTGDEWMGIEYISSFCFMNIDNGGIGSWEDKSKVHIPYNSWYGECQWKQYTLPELGLSDVNIVTTRKVSLSNTGTWSTSNYLPMGCYENTERGTILFWQIEHNGSWNWEIGDVDKKLYLLISGPTENENQWWKKLKPGEKFISVKTAVGISNGGFNTAMQELTLYRRAIRRQNKDNENLPVIFNDYMNCLWGEPTTEKLKPIINAAAEMGCEYFCVDAGWYADGPWWDGVGEWIPSQERFPNGIIEVMDYIKKHGMIPGLWLEIESMGINCQLVKKVPDTWFFKKHGKPVIYRSRYQLDFRNPQVRKHADKVIDRLVNEYGVGYIKMDYNINGGVGTEVDADSFGDGLLEHNRAYIKWVDRIFKRYPDLVIENCGSGGMRMDYAMLSTHSIQSSSDQTDYIKNGVIAACSPSAVAPEQCAVWSYPLKDGDNEETIFNMVNAMLMRIHLSGNVAEISSERKGLIREALQCYKRIRTDIRDGVPFWPLGVPNFKSSWVCLGVKCKNKIYLAVWRLKSDKDNCEISLRELENNDIEIKSIYPIINDCQYSWNKSVGKLYVNYKRQNTARIFELTF